MVSLDRENAYIYLGEAIGDKQKEYILDIAFYEIIKSGLDYYDPIYFGDVFNRNITLHIIYEVTPERCQTI